MATTLTYSWTCIILLRDGPTSIRCASLPLCPTSTCIIANLNRSSSAWGDRSLSVTSIIHSTTECDIILLLDVGTVILINYLDLNIDAARSNLLVSGVPRRFIFRYHHVLGEIQVLIVCLDDILTSWVFKTVSLGLRENLFTCEVWWCRILIYTSLSLTTLIWQTSLNIRICTRLTY